MIKFNEYEKFDMAKELTILAIQNDLIPKKNTGSETAKEVVDFLQTIADTLVVTES